MKRILLILALLAFVLVLAAQDVDSSERINDVTPPPSSLPPASY